MLGALSNAADAVSNALAGPLPSGPGAAAPPPVYYKGENLGSEEAASAGSVAGGGDNNALNSRFVVEFIHFGYVHPDVDQNFVHNPLADDEQQMPGPQRSRAYQFRACLQREGLLLAGFIRSTQQIMRQGESDMGAVGQLANAASDLLGSGTGAQAPKADDMNAFSAGVADAMMAINVDTITYPLIHQTGIRLHTIRGQYNAFRTALPNAPSNNPLTGMIGQLPAVGDKLPGVIGDTFNIIQSYLFKPFEIYRNIHIAMAEELEPAIEKACRQYSVQTLQSRYTPSFFLWYYFPPPDTSGGTGGFLGQALDWLRNNVSAFAAAEQFTEDFLIYEAPAEPPGKPFLMQAFLSAPPMPPGPGEPTPAPKELADLALRGMKKGAGVNSLPSWVEDFFREVFAINLQFIQDIYIYLLNRPVTEEFVPGEIYVTCRERVVRQLVQLLLDKLDFLRMAKQFSINLGGNSFQPGNKLTEKGIQEIRDLAPAFVDAVIDHLVGEIAMRLNFTRARCIEEGCPAMEAFLGRLPFMLSFSFKETYFPMWDFVIDNTFGKTSGLGSVIDEYKNAVRTVKGALDQGRDYYAKAQAVKNVADTQGFQGGLGGTNLGAYQNAWNNTNANTTQIPPDQLSFFTFPITDRLNRCAGARITRADYLATQPNFQYDNASDPPA